MSSKFTFGVDNFKFVVEPALFGYNVFYVSDNQKNCVCCLGDFSDGCVFSRKKNGNNAIVTYCHPYIDSEEPSFSAYRWARLVNEFTMKYKTKYGRLLIARPIVENDEIIGVHFLSKEKDSDEIKDVIKLEARQDKNGKRSIVTTMKARIINPEF